MRNIIVVECISTGTNYIEDIINRGYNPIVLELKIAETEDGEEYKRMVYENYERIDYDFDMIYEQDTYEETLEMVRKLDPILIVAGNEKGVILTTKLSNDLNLLGNPIENLDAMTLKDEMQNRLAERGLRSIRGKVVTSIEEGIDFYDAEELEAVVIKPVYSAGSASVRICSDKEEMVSALEELFSKSNYYGDENQELLIQERIDGEEYIVNTVSCNGIPRVTLIWKYTKIKTSEGAIVYDTCETVNELKMGEAEMVEYAYKVAEALGIKYGPVHGEYMIDDKGPVLIEVNCRPCGASMSAEFLDRISGQHETDSALDSYLKPDRFMEELKNKYRLFAYGALKMFIVPKDITAKATPMPHISEKIKSHYATSLVKIPDASQLFMKTEDLHTSCGLVYLVNEDYGKIQEDINFFRSVEKHAFSLVLSENLQTTIEKDDETYLSEIKPLVNISEKYGSGLLITDQFINDAKVLQIRLEDIHKIKGEFDFVIINLNKIIKEESDDIIVKEFIECLSKVRPGGLIFIPENTYKQSPSGRKGVEALIRALGLKIELPIYTMDNVVIASRS